ncbi:MAG: peptidylprolyl isomerase [Elusimicrobia bacterium]|nr:peptidylprolyl isomerase [Elusimicrobiota bacterium]
MSRVFAALLILLPFLAGCRKSSGRALARVGKSVITEAEFSRKLSEVAPNYRNYVLTPYGRRQFLDVLIREKMILSAARAAGVHLTPEYREQLSGIRREEEERLAEAGDYLLTRLWMEQLSRKGVLAVGEGEVKAYHEAHPSEVQARHILLSASEEAEAAKKAVRAGAFSPAKFAAYAQKVSLDADTAAGGGLMRPTLFGEVIPELEALFRMKNGEIGGPVRSKLGWHVILKEGERPVPFAEAEPRIRAILQKQKLDRHLQSLQDSFPVEVIDAQFK